MVRCAWRPHHVGMRLGGTMTAVAAFLFLVALAAGCVYAAVRWPRGGRIAASAVTATMALGPAGLAVSAFIYATGPDEGSFGADMAATFGIVLAGAAVLLVGLAVVILRGNDLTRWLVAMLLGAVGGLTARRVVIELAKGADQGYGIALEIFASGLAIAAAALLAGGLEVMSRRR